MPLYNCNPETGEFHHHANHVLVDLNVILCSVVTLPHEYSCLFRYFITVNGSVGAPLTRMGFIIGSELGTTARIIPITGNAWNKPNPLLPTHSM